MNKTIGIVAHVDSGKTTFSEQLLYQSGTIRKLGRVDHKNTFLDSNEIEKKRGITIFSEQAVFEYENNTYYLIDTPGHVDFSAEMERAAQAMDCAVLLVSAVEGLQNHTYTLWEVLKRKNIPVLIFINKTDRDGADIDSVIEQMKHRFSDAIISFDDGFLPQMSDELKEEVATLDEVLLEYYLSQKADEGVFLDGICRMIRNRSLFPVMSGSSLNGVGIKEFLDVMSKVISWEEEEDTTCAYVYKVMHEKGNRICYLKIQSGELAVKDSVLVMQNDKSEATEKINEMRLYNGAKFTTLNKMEKGGLCAVTGISARCGTYIGCGAETMNELCTPLLTAKVSFDEKIYSKTVVEKLKILEDEEPMLSVRFNEELGEIHVDIMGVIQIEILTEMIKSRFGLDAIFEKPSVLYKETIKSQVIGSGHFEPLRHYAEVRFAIEPAQRGSGIQFESRCQTDVLAGQYQRLIQTHVFEKTHKGVLIGADITDIKIVLLTGRAHLKHTEGGDFRESVYRAIRQGLCKADSVLLEPYYKADIEVDMEYMGRVLSDIQAMYGTFQPPQIGDSRVNITARIPVSECMEYHSEFVHKTGGRGVMRLVFDGYDSCHNEAQVIENSCYDKERDLENTPDSVFCSHGAGYPVKWYEADSHMHCQLP